MNTRDIANQIKPISFSDIEQDYTNLVNMNMNIAVSDRCRTGNNVVDYFTFETRLHTRGKYNVSFYEFVERINEFKKKKFIQNMLHYYETVKNKTKTKNQTVVLKEVYNICVSAINIFRPLVAMEIYTKYKPTCILDPCAGWGGRVVGACALNIPKYIGIDINIALEKNYEQMKNFLGHRSTTSIDMRFCDALSVDYENLPPYDMVFTSPPYYFLEKYANNITYEKKEQMNKLFYIPLFQMTHQYLQIGGTFILNVNKEIYVSVCIPLFGPAHNMIPLKKSKRQNDYGEYIYIWFKNG